MASPSPTACAIPPGNRIAKITKDAPREMPAAAFETCVKSSFIARDLVPKLSMGGKAAGRHRRPARSSRQIPATASAPAVRPKHRRSPASPLRARAFGVIEERVIGEPVARCRTFGEPPVKRGLMTKFRCFFDIPDQLSTRRATRGSRLRPIPSDLCRGAPGRGDQVVARRQVAIENPQWFRMPL